MKHTNHTVEQPTTRSTILAFLEVLEVERRALHVLDREAIEAAAHRKLELTEQLNRLLNGAGNASDAQLLPGLLQQIRRNHLLLSHARSCIGGILSLFQPQESVGYFESNRPSSAAVRLNLRG